MSAAIALAIPGIRDETSVLAAAADAGLDIRRRCVDAADLLGACLSAPGLTAVVTAQLPRLSAEVIARLHACACTVIGISVQADDHERLAALGVDALIDAGDDPRALVAEVKRALGSDTRLTSTRHREEVLEPREGQTPDGRLIAVWGPPGAPGRTTTAVTLARQLAERSRTVVIDLDLTAPSVALSLGLADDLSGIILACRHAEAGSLNSRTLQSSMAVLSSRFLALTGIPHARRRSEIRPMALERVLAQVRRDVAYGVMDIGSSLAAGTTSWPTAAEVAASAWAAADVVVAVCQAEPLGVARFLADLPDLAEQQTPIIGVITGGRMREQSRALIAEEAQRLGIDMPLTRLDLDARALASAVRRGMPITSRRRAARGEGSPAHLVALVA